MLLLAWVVASFAAALPTAAGAACSGTTYPKCGMGGGSSIYSRTAADSFGACCASCDGDGACVSWTFKADGGDYKTGGGMCELRNAAGTPTQPKQQDKISGRAPSPPTPPPPPSPAPACPAAFNVTADAICADAPDVGIARVNTSDAAACCAACATHAACATWTHFPGGTCKMRGACTAPVVPSGKGRAVGVRPAPPPSPPPAPLPPGPLPPKVAPGSQKNIVVLLTDDQDLRLGSMVALPYTQAHIGAAGANMSNFFVGTPICCPSRATLLSGRWNHNNKVAALDQGGCMSMNTSRDDNPAFWESSLPARLRRDHGYATALFGKVLNVMDTFGCEAGYKAPHLDRALIMCNHNFFNEKWADDRSPLRANATSVAINHTGSEPADYTTSIIGNASIAWMRSVIESGPDHPPFFAWLGPHAPHKPATPAPWYVDHPIGNTPIIKDPMYNYLAKGKHAFLPDEPPISAEDEKSIAYEISLRLRSLLSVDDMVAGIREYLVEAGEWDNTYFVMTSDHGYNLGQFRIDSDKTMVYDHGVRVPALIKGPGIAPGTNLPLVASMADLAPTLLELASGTDSSTQDMDGSSFAKQLLATTAAAAATTTPTPPFGRTATLIEYQNGRYKNACSKPMAAPAPQNTSCHWHDSSNNSFSAVRIIAPETGDLLFGEFNDGRDPAGWHFAPSSINYYELYNVTTDYYMLHNIYDEVAPVLQVKLHDILQTAIKCVGRKECESALSLP
jgi:N-acetylglucosamine-6-sulfatase